MSDDLVRHDPIPAEPFIGRNVTVSAGSSLARFSLRARQAADVEKLLGRSVPQKIGTSTDGVICLGPDEWLLLAPVGTALAMDSATVAVTEVSDRNVCILLEGPRATELLSAGCPLDFDRFDLGRATRTIFETVEIIVLREGAARYHVEVWRSFAPWLWTALTTIATE